MIKLPEQAIKKVEALSAERQRYAAQVLEEIAAEDDVYPLTDDERRLVREATDAMDRGEYASDAEVEAVLRRPWA